MKSRWDWIPWLLVILTPVATFFLMQAQGVGWRITMFTAIVLTALLMWFLSLLPDFVPALIAMLSFLIFGLAPESVVLSGFSSTAFMLTLSILGLGVVVVESGLTRRYTLMLLHHLPANTFAHQLMVFSTGLLFTPTVPTIVGRAAIVGPVVEHIVHGWDARARRHSSTMLYTTGLDSIHFLAPLFLTAAPGNLMVFALLPPQDQQAFDFLFWFFAASLTGIVLLWSYLFCSALFFRHAYRHVDIRKADIAQALGDLGPMRATEWWALIGVILLSLGIATINWHHIEVHLLALTVLCLMLFLGMLSRNDFIARIDWAFLFLLGSMIGIVATMNHLGIDRFIMGELSWLGVYMRQDFGLFVLALSAVFLLARLFIPLNQAIIVFAAALIPIASNAGISPWVVGFVLLILAETAFFPHQSPYIFLFDRLTSEVDHDLRRVQLFHLLLIPFKIAAILIAIPFWHRIGVL
ncbi:MAG: anion permease [Chromatiaceae bacterium]|nr:anion permease [Chromatiaceae bacterium]